METHLHNTPVYCDKFEAEADLIPASYFIYNEHQKKRR